MGHIGDGSIVSISISVITSIIIVGLNGLSL
jgi:hypothetical protein